MSFFGFTFWQDFISNSLATLLGIVAGIPIALLINSFLEQSSEREHKRKILNLLYGELEYNQHILSSWITTGAQKEDVEILVLELKHEVWSAFSDGGEIQWIKDPILLGKLAGVFSDIKALRNWAEWNMISHDYSQSVSQQVKDRLWKHMNEKCKVCATSIDETLGVLKSTIK